MAEAAAEGCAPLSLGINSDTMAEATAEPLSLGINSDTDRQARLLLLALMSLACLALWAVASVVMSAFVFLGAYGQYDMKVRHKRMLWDPPRWFEASLSAGSTIEKPFSRKRLLDEKHNRGCHILALTEVSAGDVWRANGLQHWAKQADMLHKYPSPRLE